MSDQMILTPYFLDEARSGLDDLADEGWRLIRPALPPGERMARMVSLYRPLCRVVATALQDGRRPVSLAGDCCASIPVLAGIQCAGLQPTLIWLDAHGDFNTWETTPSGFLGGMPLAMLVGRGDQTLVEGVDLVPLAEERIILCDGRDLDPGEADMLAGSDVRRLPQAAALLEQPLPPGPIYVHFDVDILDPEALPAVAYPAAGGPSPDELHEVFSRLAQTGQVAAVSVSAWDPALDPDGRSRETAMGLLETLLD